MTNAILFNRRDDVTFAAIPRDVAENPIPVDTLVDPTAELWWQDRFRDEIVGQAIVTVGEGELLITLPSALTDQLPLGKVPWLRLGFTLDGQLKSARIDLAGILP